MMSEKFPGTPKVKFPIVDVRDVALAHLRALEIEEAKNQRIILCSKGVWFCEIASALKSEFGKFYNIKDQELKYCTVKIASLFDKSVKMILPNWGKDLNLDNTRSKNILGLEYHYV